MQSLPHLPVVMKSPSDFGETELSPGVQVDRRKWPASIRANSRNESIEAIASEMFRRVSARSPAVTGFASRITLSRLILVFCPVNV